MKPIEDDSIFFDADCLSAFLWSDRGSLVTALYPGRVVIPQLVVDEMRRTRSPEFVRRLDGIIDSDDVQVVDIDVGSRAFISYQGLRHARKAIGRGEASALALAEENNGIVGSNNLSDIMEHIRAKKLRHETTAGILVRAYEEGLISSLEEGDAIWAKMIAEGDCWLGDESFSHYYTHMPRNPL